MREGLARCGWREEEEEEDEEEEGGGRDSVERERDSPVGRGHARSAPTRRRWIHRVASRKEALNYFDPRPPSQSDASRQNPKAILSGKGAHRFAPRTDIPQVCPRVDQCVVVSRVSTRIRGLMNGGAME